LRFLRQRSAPSKTGALTFLNSRRRKSVSGE